MKYFIREFDDNDKDIIKWQLKTDRVKIAGILQRCQYSYPSIFVLYPVKENEENAHGKKELDYMSISTMLWLTCPYLNKKIHQLESDGYISKITDFINSDIELMFKMENAHVRFYFLRKKFHRHFFGDIATKDDYDNIPTTGIGGIRDIENIKCLHLQYAHYVLCEDNVAGKITYNLLNGITNCKERICDNA